MRKVCITILPERSKGFGLGPNVAIRAGSNPADSKKQTQKTKTHILRCGAAEARLAHNQEDLGSKPSTANFHFFERNLKTFFQKLIKIFKTFNNN